MDKTRAAIKKRSRKFDMANIPNGSKSGKLVAFNIP